MIDTAGIYTLPMGDYLADPCPEPSFSTSVAHALLTQSPLHAWMQHPRLNPGRVREESSAMDVGTVAHSILLEGHMDNIAIVEAPDWRTKDAKAARDAARLQGKTPILAHKVSEIVAMVRAAQEAIHESELASSWKEARSEQTVIWQEGETWCKSRPDRLTKDHRVIIDLKTTAGSAEPNTWLRSGLIQNGYTLQAALYLRGVKKVCHPKDCTFVFLVVEVEPPYACSFISMSPQFLAYADRQLDRALQLWGDCLLMNIWPGYPSKIAYVDAPSYLLMQEEEHEPR